MRLKKLTHVMVALKELDAATPSDAPHLFVMLSDGSGRVETNGGDLVMMFEPGDRLILVQKPTITIDATVPSVDPCAQFTDEPL